MDEKFGGKISINSYNLILKKFVSTVSDKAYSKIRTARRVS